MRLIGVLVVKWEYYSRFEGLGKKCEECRKKSWAELWALSYMYICVAEIGARDGMGDIVFGTGNNSGGAPGSQNGAAAIADFQGPLLDGRVQWRRWGRPYARAGERRNEPSLCRATKDLHSATATNSTARKRRAC